MLTLNLTRWHKVWLSRPWDVRPVPSTAMIELHGVRGFLTAGDVAFLFNLAADVPPGGCYLEVGSWLGLSAIVVANGLLANLNLRARVYCVDTWLGSAEHRRLSEVQDGGLFARFLANVREAQVDVLVHAVRGESTEVARGWAGPRPDVIFIDGDHSAEGCYRDLCHWHPLLNAGGRLLGHDAVPGGPVEAAVGRYCRERGYSVTVYPYPQTHYVWEVRGAPGRDEDARPADGRSR